MAAAIETEASFSFSFSSSSSGEEKGGAAATDTSPSPSPSPSPPPFRIIVVGGGLLGLTAAHMLAKAGLDFVVLEQHADLLPEIGSLLSLLPPTFRVLDQLGLLDAVGPVLGRHDRSVFIRS
ncbi:putative FAD binding domain-containing protein [Rosellinia necatrix]|uniref:Putative FAD binding domain-containing protein n=1 Tax=Rosellinia necatrix TaxID=77044 RepID=A0A1W2TAQ6_ROSNE|nr:putative FAD binding domain-containing protein [Rosellinia necatrix]